MHRQTCINTPSNQLPWCWQGSDCDLLVDTGVGVHSLPRYLAWAGLRPGMGAQADKPLQVITAFSIV